LPDKTPDFIKSIPTWKAIEDTTLVAYEMNGVPLPHLHGFPARLIVPGWTGTYWMKHLTSIKPVTKPESGFWMTPAYRIPLGKFSLVARFTSQETAVNTPITEIVVSSLITNPADGANVKMGPVAIGGIAWDGGYGISTVEVSSDGGKTWVTATLGEDLGRFAFRTFSYDFAPKAPGKQTVMARLEQDRPKPDDRADPQPGRLSPHNVVHSVTFNVA
jgi:sulfite dehydrogenase